MVEGGSDIDVALAIYENKGVGCNPNGTTVINITDPVFGFAYNVGFDRPTYIPIYATLNIHPLTGWTDSMLVNIQNAVVAYLNNLQIGEEVTLSALYGVATSLMPSLVTPQFSINLLTIGTSIGSQSTSNISIAFNAVAQSQTAYVTVSKV